MADIRIENHGSVFLAVPNTSAGTEWLASNVGLENSTYFGNALAVEPRYAGALVEGMLESGLEVE